jgi:hypothetical protein
MSWRDVLGVANVTHDVLTQNTHNTQKTPKSGISAHIADFAEGDSKFLEVLSTACADLSISPVEVRDALAPEDVESWQQGHLTPDNLMAFARSLVQRREMNQGRVPEHYTKHATCKQCGPVWLWFAGEVLACPWCWNRIAGRPIPRPMSVRCGDCSHFRRINHPHLGHCAQGEPEAPAGLWDTDPRGCDNYTPKLDSLN